MADALAAAGSKNRVFVEWPPRPEGPLMTRWIAAALAALCLAACGGGGENPADPQNPGSSPPPASGTIDLERRSDVTALVAYHYEELLRQNHPDPWEALRTFALQQPEFSDAGHGDGAFWARFTDGRMFVYYANWTPAPLAEAQPGTTPAAAAAAAATAVAEVPASRRAIYLKLAHEDFDYANGLITRMQAALQPHGWVADSERVLTVETLKKVQGQGFVFLNSHASGYPDGSGSTYGIMTEDFADWSGELAHKDDLDAGVLLYSRSRGDILQEIARQVRWQDARHPRYTATHRFVRKYMHFAPHSLVVLMMCNSGSPQAAAMRQAFLDQGAGTVMAWQGFANPMGYPTVEALVDRMTGANRPVRLPDNSMLMPPAEPNRAFERRDVVAFLQKTGLLDQPSIDGNGTTRIVFEGEGFQLFHPVITSLTPTGRDRLIVNGRFGTVPQPTITIDGTPVPVDRWADDGSRIEVTLPTGPSDPPGSKGKVVVEVAGLKSNARMLTSWRGDIRYGYEELYGAEPDVFRNVGIAHLHIRYEGHGVRTEVDGPVADHGVIATVASDSHAEWLAEGGCATCHLFQAWSGRKEKQPFHYGIDLTTTNPPDYGLVHDNNAIVLVDAKSRRLQLFVQVGNLADFTVTTFGVPVQVGESRLHKPDIELFWPVPTGPWTGVMPYAAQLPFGSGQDVAASQVQKTVQFNSGSVPRRHTIAWTAFTASPAHDDSIGR